MCVCPSGYVDDGSGGCTSVPGMFTLLLFANHHSCLLL